MDNKGLVIVMSGFSGAGKGTIMKHIMSKYPDRYFLSISATTRKIRQGEEDGREYFFKSREEFETMIQENALLEYNYFNNNYYGTPKEYVEKLVDEGKDVFLEIDVHGAVNIRKIYPEALLLFVMPPDAKSLKDRLIGRGTETEEEITNRLSISCKEAEQMKLYDYLIVNDEIDRSVSLVHDIIEIEHFRVNRNPETIQNIKDDLKIYAKGE